MSHGRNDNPGQVAYDYEVYAGFIKPKPEPNEDHAYEDQRDREADE